jgi:hypothetical protein
MEGINGCLQNVLIIIFTFIFIFNVYNYMYNKKKNISIPNKNINNIKENKQRNYFSAFDPNQMYLAV